MKNVAHHKKTSANYININPNFPVNSKHTIILCINAAA